MEFLKNFIEITGNETADTIIIAVIESVTALVAYDVVGVLFRVLGIYDIKLMSDCNFLVKTIIFIFLSFIIIGMANLIELLFNPYYIIYIFVFFTIVITFIVGCILIKLLMKNKVSYIVINYTEISNNNMDNKEEIDYSRCPRCGGKLEIRHGPYGSFYGCHNYPITGCKYTRKIK